MVPTVDPASVEAATPEQPSAGTYKALPSGFTPGPWSADLENVPYAEFEGEATWTVNADGGSICTLDCPKAEREANARLIAAAPDLLEALKAILGDHTTGGTWRTEGDVIEAARAAIAKATPASLPHEQTRGEG